VSSGIDARRPLFVDGLEMFARRFYVESEIVAVFLSRGAHGVFKFSFPLVSVRALSLLLASLVLFRRNYSTELRMASSYLYFGSRKVLASVSSSQSHLSSISVVSSSLSSATVTGKGFDWESTIPLNVLENIWHEVVGQEKSINVVDKGGKSVITVAADIQGEEEGPMAARDIQTTSSLIYTSELPETYDHDLSRADKDIKQSDAFRIRNQLSEEEKDEQNFPIVTSGTLDTATSIAINSDEPDGKVDQAGNGIMPVEEQKLESTPTSSITGTAIASAATTSDSTESHIRPTSMTEDRPEVSSMYPSTSKQNNKKDLSKFINDVMGNVCTIFPAVVNLSERAARDSNTNTTYTNTGEPTPPLHQSHILHHPFITFHPSYLNCISGEDLLLAFDQLMVAGSVTTDRPFLHSDCGASSSWMDHVFALMTSGQDELALTLSSSFETVLLPAARPSASISIPLYILVLARIQMSVVNSYQNYNKLSESVIEREVLSAMIPEGRAAASEVGVSGGPVDAAKLHNLLSMLKVLNSESLSYPASEFPEVLPSVGMNSSSYVNRSLEDYLMLPFPAFFQRISSNLADKGGDVWNLVQSLNMDFNVALNTDEVSVELNDIALLSKSDKGSSATVVPAEDGIESGIQTTVEIEIEGANTSTKEENTSPSAVGTEVQISKKSKKKKKKKVRS
jgi:hypothetical protein